MLTLSFAVAFMSTTFCKPVVILIGSVSVNMSMIIRIDSFVSKCQRISEVNWNTNIIIISVRIVASFSLLYTCAFCLCQNVVARVVSSLLCQLQECFSTHNSHVIFVAFPVCHVFHGFICVFETKIISGICGKMFLVTIEHLKQRYSLRVWTGFCAIRVNFHFF